MKHFIGGSAVSFLISVWLLPDGSSEKLGADRLFNIVVFMSCIGGIAAWGLLP